MASDCAIGRNTPPCSRQDGGSRAAWSSTRYSGKSPRLGGSGYERLSSGIRSVRWKESLKWASACTSWNEKWSVSWWTSIMVDSLKAPARVQATRTCSTGTGRTSCAWRPPWPPEPSGPARSPVHGYDDAVRSGWMGVGVRAPGHHRERSATERLQALREGRDLDDEFAYEI